MGGPRRAAVGPALTRASPLHSGTQAKRAVNECFAAEKRRRQTKSQAAARRRKEALEKRMGAYHKMTAPILEYYKK